MGIKSNKIRGFNELILLIRHLFMARKSPYDIFYPVYNLLNISPALSNSSSVFAKQNLKIL